MTNHDELCDSIRAIVRNCMKEPWSTRTDTNRTFDDICNGGTEAIIKIHENKIKELRTRVAELTKKGENLCTSHGLLLCAHDTLKKKNEELQNRLSTLEKEKDELLKKLESCRQHVWDSQGLWCKYCGTQNPKEEIDGLRGERDKIKHDFKSLLKASEGLEKALEESNELASLYAYDFQARLQHPRNQAEIDGNFETVEKAKQSLANFRAVKEEK